MIGKNEQEQMEKSWTIIQVVWSALFTSLGLYLLIGKIIEGGLRPVAEIPFETLRIILYGAAVFIFFATSFMRTALLKLPEASSAAPTAPLPPIHGQNLAAGKYLTAIITTAALSESIGVCGLVYFVLSKDSATLYLFIGVSAIAMLFYRPRKAEFLELAAAMQKQGRGKMCMK